MCLFFPAPSLLAGIKAELSLFVEVDSCKETSLGDWPRSHEPPPANGTRLQGMQTLAQNNPCCRRFPYDEHNTKGRGSLTPRTQNQAD